jgi:tRNA (guanine-N7-)-methyltransferase
VLMIYSPVSPVHMDWSSYYPAYVKSAEEAEESSLLNEVSSGKNQASRQLRKDVEVADIGCGFGGLLVALAPVLPDTLLLGRDALPNAPN